MNKSNASNQTHANGKRVCRKFVYLTPLLAGMAGCLWIAAITFLPDQKVQTCITPDRVIKDSSIHAYEFVPWGIVVLAMTNHFDFIYTPSRPVSIKDVATESNYRYVINGSFFERSGEHAGVLSILGEMHTPHKPDAQLTHIVRYAPETGAILFLPNSELTGAGRLHIEFQTGPLVIENNRVMQQYIQESANGHGLHKRTLLGYTEGDGTKYFIIVKNAISLDTLGELLLRFSIFSQKKLHVVNLDGGPSVALYAKNHQELNYNTKARLPILLAIR